MNIRASSLDPTAAELARRRLSMLGADLSGGRGGDVRPAAAGLTTDEQAGPQSAPPAAGRRGRHVRERIAWSSRVAARAADGTGPALHGRFHVTAQHLTVVALTLSAAMALAAWLLVRSAPEPVPRTASLELPADATAGPTGVVAPGAEVEPPPAADAPIAAASTVPAGPTTGTGSRELLVHVTGKVRRPGVVELPAGSRVVDAIEAAGGARQGARLGLLNLARVLVDGEQVAVGVAAATAAVPPVAPGASLAASSAAPTAVPVAGLVNLNTATQPELEELPGVGPVTATSILDWRAEHGGFSTVDELIEVSGIGEVTLAELRDLVTV